MSKVCDIKCVIFTLGIYTGIALGTYSCVGTVHTEVTLRLTFFNYLLHAAPKASKRKYLWCSSFHCWVGKG